jgi:peptidoglycan/LPS O-acetylase OafA/YrhL
LTSLRAVAALMVFGYHLRKWDVWSPPLDVTALGYVGVSFFVLSGFVLVWATSPDDRARDCYRRRFARVYPSHLAMLLVAAIVPFVPVDRSWPSAAASAALVQSWFASDDHVAYGMNGVSWSLSCEAFFYAMFPLALVVLRQVDHRQRCMLALGWYAITSLFVVAAAAHGGGAAGNAFVNPAIRFAEFLFGIVAALSLGAATGPRPGPLSAWVGLVCALVVVVTCLRLPAPTPGLIFVLPFVGLVLAAATSDVTGKRGWLTNRRLIYAGQLSFAFYLVHELVIVNARSAVPLSGLPAAVLYLALASLAGIALDHLVELRVSDCCVVARHSGEVPRRPSSADRFEVSGHSRPGAIAPVHRATTRPQARPASAS